MMSEPERNSSLDNKYKLVENELKAENRKDSVVLVEERRLKKTVSFSDNSTATDVIEEVETHKSILLKIKEVCKYLGPAWLVAMAYLDPGNIEGDLAAGSLRHPDDKLRGFRLLWVLLWATIIGFILQRLGIVLGVATGQDLAVLAYKTFPRWMCIFIWIVTEMCLIGIDMQAVIGSGIAFTLLFGVPTYVGILVTLVDTFVILLITVFGTQKLELLFGLMVGFMGICFFYNLFVAGPPASSILTGLIVPTIPKGTMRRTVILIGCVIMPHNFFLQTSVVQSRPVDRTNSKEVSRVIKIYSYETFFALCISLACSIAVMSAFAYLTIPENETLTLYNAHDSLKSSLGNSSSVVWGLGLLAAGTCSTIAGTYCGQFVLEGLLNVRIKRLWLRMLVTRLISIVPVLAIVLLTDKTIEAISDFVNIMQALWMPFILTILIKFSSSKELMKDMSLSWFCKILSYISGIFLTAVNVAFIITETGNFSAAPALYVAICVYMIALVYLWWRPLTIKQSSFVVEKNENKHFVAT